MLSFVVGFTLLVTVNSIPLSPLPPSQNGGSSTTTPVPIIRQTDVDNGDGNFTFGFQAGNGIVVQESGYVKQGPQIAARNAGEQPENTEIQVIAGSFAYPAPDGTNITLTYIADENGFQPEGAHLPTPPPLPESVQRLLSALNNAPAAIKTATLQAAPSANYENVVQPASASRSGKSVAVSATPTAAASPAATPSAATAPASTSAAAPTSSAPASADASKTANGPVVNIVPAPKNPAIAS